MSVFTGDTGGGGSAFGALSWNTVNHPGATGTWYLPPCESAPVSVEYFHIVAGPGTYTELKVVSSGSLSIDSVTFTIRKNGVDTALVAVLAAGQTSVTVTGSLAVVAGDRISLKVVQSGSEIATARSGIGLY